MVNHRYRVYANAQDQFANLSGVDYNQSEDEILQGQVALVYAQDVAGQGHFQANFGVIPQQILRFKKETANKVKFFVSMGGQDFTLAAGNVPNAVDSLAQIIATYNLDGVDVCYERIPVGPEQFVDVMEKVIRNLKGRIPNLEVSITVPPPLNDLYYGPLYGRVLNLIDYVIYQAYLVAHPVATVSQLAGIYSVLPYPAAKLFAGYSVRLPSPVFREGHRVLHDRGLISGTSDWVAT